MDLCQVGIAVIDDDGRFYVRELFVQEVLEEFFEETYKEKEMKDDKQ